MENEIQQWRVGMEFALDSEEGDLPPGDKRVPVLDNWLSHAHKGGAFATQRGWIATVMVPVSAQVRSISQAETHGEELIAHCVRTLGLPASNVVSRSAIDANTYVAELEVYGSQELAELLSVSRQRLAQLRAEGTLPEPDAVLAATPVWRRRTIDSFTFGWRRRPGPPPANVGPDIDIDQLFSST